MLLLHKSVSVVNSRELPLVRVLAGKFIQQMIARSSEQVNDRSPYSKIRLGIVCPMANEEATAASFVDELLAECKGQNFKSVTLFVVLDRMSKDRTHELLENLAERQVDLKVLWAAESKCRVDAYVAGYRAALEAGSDWILEIDGGFSHQPADARLFFARMLQGCDCVFGSRFCEGGTMTESPWARYLLSRGGTLLTNLLLGTRLKDMTSGYELFTREMLQHILNKGIRSRGPFFQTEIKAYCRNFRVAESPIQYRNASPTVDRAALTESLGNLGWLFKLRLRAEL
jgi:dolichol-phosphate mannosyltransferase